MADNGAMRRWFFLAYGSVAYVLFLITITYAVGFVADFVVPKSIDSGISAPPGQAVLINVGLLSLFVVQHSIMARPWFKRWWTRIVPQPIERSTFVLVTSALLLFIFWQWRPMPRIVWHVGVPSLQVALYALSGFGWFLVLYSSFLIDHFDLFGLRQVVMHFRNHRYTHPGFALPALYRMVRNPLMLGFLIAFWSTPVMTRGHLLFAVLTTAYIFFGIQLEERDLSRQLGDDYRRYRAATPMILPRPWCLLPGRGVQPTPAAELGE